MPFLSWISALRKGRTRGQLYACVQQRGGEGAEKQRVPNTRHMACFPRASAVVVVVCGPVRRKRVSNRKKRGGRAQGCVVADSFFSRQDKGWNAGERWEGKASNCPPGKCDCDKKEGGRRRRGKKTRTGDGSLAPNDPPFCVHAPASTLRQWTEGARRRRAESRLGQGRHRRDGNRGDKDSVSKREADGRG